tara:strand:- start:146 stop:523 length:378 start_codon:yes stop_codon:yes gene_type:complete
LIQNFAIAELLDRSNYFGGGEDLHLYNRTIDENKDEDKLYSSYFDRGVYRYIEKDFYNSISDLRYSLSGNKAYKSFAFYLIGMCQKEVQRLYGKQSLLTRGGCNLADKIYSYLRNKDINKVNEIK